MSAAQAIMNRCRQRARVMQAEVDGCGQAEATPFDSEQRAEELAREKLMAGRRQRATQSREI
jgi:hypothetical protein